MGYSFYIGNAIPVFPSEGNENTFSWEVERVEHPDAPEWKHDRKSLADALADASKKTNGRHPQITQMKHFCKQANIEGLFFDGDGCLVPRRSCVTRLTKSHCHKITFARQKWEEEHPDSVPGWYDNEDPILARLIWYEFWMKWALGNCGLPAVEND